MDVQNNGDPPGDRTQRGGAAPEACRCGRFGRLIEPSLLLLLARKPSYGYELMEELSRLGFFGGEPDAGGIYRNLRQMEKEKLVESEWDTSGTGPARRQYRLTSHGERQLHGWAASMKTRKKALERFLRTYEELAAARGWTERRTS